MQKEPLAFVYSQDSQKTTASWLCFCLLRAQVRMTFMNYKSDMSRSGPSKGEGSTNCPLAGEVLHKS